MFEFKSKKRSNAGELLVARVLLERIIIPLLEAMSGGKEANLHLRAARSMSCYFERKHADHKLEELTGPLEHVFLRTDVGWPNAEPDVVPLGDPGKYEFIKDYPDRNINSKVRKCTWCKNGFMPNGNKCINCSGTGSNRP